MRLTNFSDYSLRILMYAATRDGKLVTIEETAAVYGISRAHLMKVANLLVHAGFLKSIRGRAGGLMLAKPPARSASARCCAQPNRISLWSNVLAPITVAW